MLFVAASMYDHRRSPGSFGLGTSTAVFSFFFGSKERCVEFHGRRGSCIIYCYHSFWRASVTSYVMLISPTFTPWRTNCLHTRCLIYTEMVKKVTCSKQGKVTNLKTVIFAQRFRSGIYASSCVFRGSLTQGRSKVRIFRSA